jgi:peptide/nickel transport system substrate-binding protein
MKRSEFLKASAGLLALPAVARAQPADTLRAGLKLSPTSMDPHFRLSGEQNILRALHARLVGMTPDGKPEPGIAQSWRPVQDGRAWEFTLREDARFSDGSPITAEDVA